MEDLKSSTLIRPQEMRVIASMHNVAQLYDVVLACARCRQPFQGLNTPTDNVYTIECGCRSLTSVAPQVN